MGKIYTKTVKISELEHVIFDELFENNHVGERSSRGLYNKEVAFRIKSTKELLLFDYDGVWH